MRFAGKPILISVLFVAAGFCSPRAWAQAAPAASAPQSPLSGMAWMVGSWVGEEKDPDGSVTYVFIRCRWAENHQALMFDASYANKGLDGPRTPQYDGMFIWHPEHKKIVLWQVNRKGEVAEGELTAQGNQVDQTVRAVHVDGGQHFLKSHYDVLTANEFRFRASFRPSESVPWRDVLDLVYRRIADLPQVNSKKDGSAK